MLEETGLDVEVVRELGRRRPPRWRVLGALSESHFLHATTTGATPAEWDHEVGGDLFRCRWVELAADTRVHGRHGAFIHALVATRSGEARHLGS